MQVDFGSDELENTPYVVSCMINFMTYHVLDHVLCRWISGVNSVRHQVCDVPSVSLPYC